MIQTVRGGSSAATSARRLEAPRAPAATAR